MDDKISELLELTVTCMANGGSLQDLHETCEAFALAHIIPDKSDHEAAAMMACGMSRALWRSMPNPSRQFQIEKLPALGRNDKCAIGLPCKHKQCCGAMPDFPVFDAEHCWAILCEVLPANRMQDILDSGRLPDGMLALVAHRLLETDPERVRALLAPRFAGKLNPKEKHAGDLMWALCDAYDMLDEPKKKIALLERIAVEAGGQTRADALQRLSSVYSDSGDFNRAWNYFHEAQRASPDDISLAHLEILMLVSQKRDADARERAKFWAAKIMRAGYDEAEFPLLGWLRQIGQGLDPKQATAELTADQLAPWEKRMIAAVEAGLAKPVSTQHLRAVDVATLPPETPEAREAELVKQLIGMGLAKRDAIAQAKSLAADIAAQEKELDENSPEVDEEDVDDTRKNEHVLTPDAHLASLEDAWHRAWPLAKPLSTHPLPDFTADVWAPPQVEFWVAFLEQHPGAMDSPDILDDLIFALADMPTDAATWAATPVREKIRLRVRAMLDVVVPPGAILPWGIHENRPALRILAQEAMELFFDGEPDALKRLQVVIRLNPNDNYGMRDHIVNLHLERGENADALEVCAAYPDDGMPALAFGKALAHFRLGELPLATTVLKKAHKHSPKIVKFMLPARKAQPRSSALGIEFGGDDEAWNYRDAMREVWQSTPGAMAWLKKTVG